MKLLNTAIKNTTWIIAYLTIFFFFFATSPAKAVVLFEDDFDGSQSGSWLPMSVGAPEYLDYITSNGDTFLRMTSIMSDEERRGIYNTNTFNFSEGQIIVDFRTMPYDGQGIPAENSKNIDGLLSFMLYSKTGPDIEFHIFGGEFGSTRDAVIIGDGYGVASEIGIWNYEQDYRIVVKSVGETTKVSFLDDRENVLFAQTFDFDLGALGDFKILLMQFMGLPLAEYYSDVAIDRIIVDGPVTANIDIYPDTLNKRSKGKYITCYIELEDYNVEDIDIETVMLKIDSALISAELSFTEIGDYNGNNVPDYKVKFDRTLVQDASSPGVVRMTIFFKNSDGISFEGNDTVLVIDKGQPHISKDHGSVVY